MYLLSEFPIRYICRYDNFPKLEVLIHIFLLLPFAYTLLCTVYSSVIDSLFWKLSYSLFRIAYSSDSLHC